VNTLYSATPATAQATCTRVHLYICCKPSKRFGRDDVAEFSSGSQLLKVRMRNRYFFEERGVVNNLEIGEEKIKHVLWYYVDMMCDFNFNFYGSTK
jgi:hypothetical protein